MVSLSVLIAGCSTNTDSMEITDQQFLTLVRRQVLPWKQDYDRELVVASLPECMRRYNLDRDETGNDSLEVYRLADKQYLLKGRTGAWVADLANCSLTKSPSVTSGEKIGVFESRGQVLRFTRLSARNPEQQ
jgi:hypothetical protein